MSRIKKAELHLHLDGSLRPETVKELAIKRNILPDSISIDDVKKLLTVNSSNPDLVQYLKKFDLPVELLQDKKSLKRVAYELAEDLANEDYIYAEVRVAPIQHLNKGLAPVQVVESILEGFNKAEEKYKIKVNLLLCAMRHLSPEKNRFLLDLAYNFRDRGVVGLDLAGDEAGYPPTIFKSFFKEAQNRGIKFTIHAGEARGAESVIKAINLGAYRLGHGIRSFEDDEAIELIKKNDICLECCPISNYNTKAIDDFYKYPILDFLEAGIAATLNTDNRTVSNTNYLKEIDFLKHYTNINEEHIKQLNINAIKHAFISEELKEKLLKEI